FRILRSWLRRSDDRLCIGTPHAARSDHTVEHAADLGREFNLVLRTLTITGGTDGIALECLCDMRIAFQLDAQLRLKPIEQCGLGFRTPGLDRYAVGNDCLSYLLQFYENR